MSHFRLTYTHPWLLLLLIPAIALTLIPYFRTARKYRKTRNKIISVVSHLTAMFLAINLLAGISFAYEKPNLDNELVILVDVTDSGAKRAEDRDGFVNSIIDISDGEYRMGIVKFGFGQTDTGELTYDSEELLNAYYALPDPDGTATDLATALKHAKGMIKNPESAKIVVISDGKETDNTSLSVIKSIAAEGIKVDTVYMPHAETDDVAIYAVQTPSGRIVLGENFITTITLKSNLTGEHEAILRAYDGFGNKEEAIGETTVVLNGEEQQFEVVLAFEERGMHELRFEIVLPDDTITENNSYRTFINLAAFDNILLIEGHEGEGARLAALLKERFNVTDISATDDLTLFPRTITELAEYEQVILVNMAYSDMPAGFEELLNEYVYNLGGGLFTVGGQNDVLNGVQVPHAYNRNDIAASTYFKQMLPVNAVDYTPPIAVVIVVDTSASMSSGRLEAAKEGALACLDALQPRDYCGEVSFETRATEELQVLPASQKDKIIDSIRHIAYQSSAQGGTIFSDAIKNAGQALSVITNVERKHIIMVTDGRPGDTYDTYLPYIERNLESGITMSIVVVDTPDDAVASQMQKTADAAGGKFHSVPMNSLEEIPKIMQGDLAMQAVDEFYDCDPFQMTIKDRTAAVAGIEQALIPNLSGYYGTAAKKDAKVPLMGKYVPLYAEWQYGAGNVGSFMCDLSGIWSAEFMDDLVGQAIITNIVNSLFPMEDVRAEDFSYVIKTENYISQLNVHGVPEGGWVEVEVTPLSAHLSSVIEDGITVQAQESNRRFSFVIKDSGLYEVRIMLYDEAGTKTAEAVEYKAFSYSQEYNSFTDREPLGEELMLLLATDGKGQTVEDPAQVFAGFSDTIKKEYDPRVLFLILTIILVLIDIAVRKFKFKWPHELIRDYKLKKQGETKDG